MSEKPSPDREFTHTVTVFTVAAGMIGVCLTAIGLVQINAQLTKIRTFCDDLLVIDALLFGLATWAGYRGLSRHVRFGHPLSLRLMDWSFGLGLGLMVLICLIFSFSLL